MAIQVLAGVPWLAGLMGGWLVSLVGFFGQYLTRRLAIIGAMIVAATALVTAIMATLLVMFDAIASSLPNVAVAGLGHFVPENWAICLSSIFTAELLKYAYQWNVNFMWMKSI